MVPWPKQAYLVLNFVAHLYSVKLQRQRQNFSSSLGCRNSRRRLQSAIAAAGAVIEYIAGKYVNVEKPTFLGAKNLKLKI
jgi:hypothetical protein